MPVATDKVLATYAETGCYHQTAELLGMKYDAVRKRVKAHDPYPIVPGKSILYKGDPESPIQQVWSKGGPDKGPTVEDIEEATLAILAGYKRPPAIKPLKTGNKELLGIWPLADLHMGMRAWGKETGGPDWDISIATEAYQEGLTEITGMTPPVKHGVVLVAGDLAHADTLDYKTTGFQTQHVLDCDGRYPHMLEASVNIVIYAVHRALERCDTVDVVVLPGNHDGLTAVAVRLILAATFEKSKQVTVNKSPSRYWWFEWGRCMFAATHGDKANIKRLPGYMAECMSEMWGRTKHRFCFTGHLHTKLVEQHPGVRVEILPTPVAPDSFASEHGYSSPRLFETKIYHRDRGLRHTPTVTL